MCWTEEPSAGEALETQQLGGLPVNRSKTQSGLKVIQQPQKRKTQKHKRLQIKKKNKFPVVFDFQSQFSFCLSAKSILCLVQFVIF